MSNNGKKTRAPNDLKRFTIQADNYLFKMVQGMATAYGVNGYVLVNAFLIMGADHLAKLVRDKRVNVPIEHKLLSKHMKELRDWVKTEINRNLKEVDTDLKENVL